jgi:hypothetical protein
MMPLTLRRNTMVLEQNKIAPYIISTKILGNKENKNTQLIWLHYDCSYGRRHRAGWRKPAV